METPFLSVVVEDGSGYGSIWSWDHTLQEEEFITLGGTGRHHWFMTIYLCVSSEVPIVLSLGVLSLRCIAFVYAVEYLFNDAEMCCILLCFICLTL